MAKAKTPTFLESLVKLTQVNSSEPIDLTTLKLALAKDNTDPTGMLLDLFKPLRIRRLSMAKVEQLMEVYSQRDYNADTTGKKPMWVDRTIEYTNNILHHCIIDDANNSIFAPHDPALHSGHASESLSYHTAKDLVDQCERVNGMYEYAKKNLIAAVGESESPKTSEGT